MFRRRATARTVPMSRSSRSAATSSGTGSGNRSAPVPSRGEYLNV